MTLVAQIGTLAHVSHSKAETHPTLEEQLTALVLQKTGRNVSGMPYIRDLKVVGNVTDGFDILGRIPSEYRSPYHLKQLAQEALMQRFDRSVLVVNQIRIG